MKSRNGNVCVYSSHINDLGVAVVKQWGKNIHFVVLCLFRCLGRPEGAEASASEHSRAQRLWVDDLVRGCRQTTARRFSLSSASRIIGPC